MATDLIASDIGTKSTPRELPQDWSYEQSSSQFRQKRERLIVTFRTAQIELVDEVWVAHQMCSNQGHRRDLKGPARTFEGWCHDAGIHPATGYRWVQRWDPLLREKKPATSSQLRRSTVTPSASSGVEKPDRGRSTSSQLREGHGPHLVAPTMRIAPALAPAIPTDSVPDPDSGVLHASEEILELEDPDIARSDFKTDSQNVGIAERLRALHRDIPTLTKWPSQTADQRAEGLEVADQMMRRLAKLRRDLLADGPVDDEATVKSLKQRVRETFTAKTSEDQFNWPRENGAVKELVERAMSRDSPESFLHDLLLTFWKLVTGSEKYWSAQPFLPSRLASSGVYAGVLKAMENGKGTGLSQIWADVAAQSLAKAAQ